VFDNADELIRASEDIRGKKLYKVEVSFIPTSGPTCDFDIGSLDVKTGNILPKMVIFLQN